MEQSIRNIYCDSDDPLSSSALDVYTFAERKFSNVPSHNLCQSIVPWLQSTRKTSFVSGKIFNWYICARQNSDKNNNNTDGEDLEWALQTRVNKLTDEIFLSAFRIYAAAVATITRLPWRVFAKIAEFSRAKYNIEGKRQNNKLNVEQPFAFCSC